MTDERPRQHPAGQRAPYAKPVLAVHGKVGELTATSGFNSANPADTRIGAPTCFFQVGGGPPNPQNNYPNCYSF